MQNTAERKALRLPRLGTIVLVAATIGAAWLIVPELLRPGADPLDELRQNNPLSRIQAVEALVRQGSDGVPELVRALSNTNRLSRVSALIGLGQLGPQASGALDNVRRALRDEDPEVRSNAVSAFWRITQDTSVAVSALVPMLSDSNEDVRQTTNKTLNLIGRSDARPFVAMLESDSNEVRIAAWRILRPSRNWVSAERVDEKVRSLLNHPNADVRAEALFTTVYWGNASRAQIREMLQTNYRGFVQDPHHEPDVSVVDVCLKAMLALDPEDPEFLPEISWLLEHQDPLEEIQKTGYSLQGQMTEIHAIHPRFYRLLQNVSRLKTAAKPVAKTLIQTLDKLLAANRILVVGTLLDIGCDPDDVIPILVPLLTESIRDYVVQWREQVVAGDDIARQAAIMLTKASPGEARRQVTRLIDELGSIETEVDKTVLYALWGFGPVAQEAATALTPLVAHQDNEIRWHAIVTLGEIGPEAAPAVPSLIAQLDRTSQRPESEMNERILEALGRIGTGAIAAIPAITDVVETPVAYAPPLNRTMPMLPRMTDTLIVEPALRLRLMAISSLGKVGHDSPQALASLRRRLTVNEGHERMVTIKALGQVGKSAEAVLADIMPLLRDEDVAVRAHAALAIGRLTGNRKPAIELLEDALGDSNPHARAAAAMALGRIGLDAQSALSTLYAARTDDQNLDPLWYSRLPGWTVCPPWCANAPEIPWTTTKETIDAAIAEIERPAND